jgi:V8-like Glu-specific endopeptidase
MVKGDDEVIGENDRPLLVKEWARTLRSQTAKASAKNLELVLASVNVDPALGRSLKLRRDHGRVELVGRPARIGTRVFPPAVKTISLARAKRIELASPPEGFRPRHLDFRAIPQQLPKELRQPNRVRPSNLRSRRDMGLATNVFSPDDRFTFSDTAFPWSTCGRVDTAAGFGSGVMIGPRHLMTASHVVNWKAGSGAGWLKFTALRFDTSEPFGHAFATTIYSWNKADGSDGINADECAFDYVVCVLDRRLGDVTGWMGSRGYSTGWDGGKFWGHVGYPSDLASGTRPAFVGYQAMDSTFTRSIGGRDSFGIKHRIDVIPGQSGGPYFGWWANEAWPRVVGTQSAHQWGSATGPNTCGGGNPLPELINHARTVDP